MPIGRADKHKKNKDDKSEVRSQSFIFRYNWRYQNYNQEVTRTFKKKKKKPYVRYKRNKRRQRKLSKRRKFNERITVEGFSFRRKLKHSGMPETIYWRTDNEEGGQWMQIKLSDYFTHKTEANAI